MKKEDIAKYINLSFNNGDSCMSSALFKGNMDIFNRLLSLGGKIDLNEKFPRFDETYLHLAASRGQKTLVDFYLENGIDINTMDKDGNTPLTYAIMSEEADMATYLISKGAKVNLVDKKNISILGYAFKTNFKGSDELINLILDKLEEN